MITLRKLTPEDAPAYRELRLLGLQESPTAFGSSLERESPQPMEFFANRLAERPGCMSMGTFAEDRLIGVVSFVRDEGVKTQHRGAIYGMYVHPDWRRKKVGHDMLKALLTEADHMPGLRSVRLSVTVGNEAAQRLYESLGFTVYGEEPEVLFVDNVFYGERHLTRKSPASVAES